MENKGRYKLSRVWGTAIRDGPVDLVGGGGGGRICKKKFAEPQKGIKKICTPNFVKKKMYKAKLTCSSSHLWKAHLVITHY